MKRIETNINKGIYLSEGTIKLDKESLNNVIEISDREISTYLGMGGAISEASGYNYSLLSDDKKKELLELYYTDKGLDYNLGRIGIASNDFSLNSYQYTYKKDLSDFNIERDKLYIIPLLNDIYKYKKIDIVASPWSPPAFMKNTKLLTLGGHLKKKYYDLYSDYLIKFINEYKALGFNIKYITIQNEPYARQFFESCLFSLDEQYDFIYNCLINKLDDVKIILHDHNREDLINVIDKLYREDEKIYALGTHYYAGKYLDNLRNVKNKYKDLKIINTEMCCGYSSYNEIGWIKNAEIYLDEIIDGLNNGISSYIDWNILLDFSGGPSHIKNYVTSPIILNEDKSDLIITPIYYYLYHIAHFIKEGYMIVENTNNTNLHVLTAKNNNEEVIVILNNSNEDIAYSISIDNKYINDVIEHNSIITYKK